MTNDLEQRMVEYKSKKNNDSYTFTTFPLELKCYLDCSGSRDAIQYEKKIKGWPKRKKQALIDENWQDLVKFSKNYTDNNDVRM
jgi:putative endonuclease